MTRDFFQTGAEVVVGSRCLGTEVTRGRGGSGAEVSEFRDTGPEDHWPPFSVVLSHMTRISLSMDV